MITSPATLQKNKTPTKKGQKIFEFKNVDPAAKIALYFGFTPVSGPIAITKEDRERGRSLSETDAEHKTSTAPLSFRIEEKLAMLRYCEAKKLHEGPQPIELAIEVACPPSLRGGEGRRGGNPSGGGAKKQTEKTLSLEIIGAGKAIAEAILIETAFAILRDEGYADLSVSINSIGERDAQNRFARESNNYYRRNIAILPAVSKTLLKRSPFELLMCSHEKCRALAADAPKSVAFLGDASRELLKEVLEYLEELEIPYQMNPLLIAPRSFGTETVFEIRGKKKDGEEKALAIGCRYNTLTKRLGWRREAPAVGLKILLARGKSATKSTVLKFAAPKIFFLQLGTRAKLKSLKVIETLRQAGIALEHSLAREKLLSQLSLGEHNKHSYSLIMGQREALEESVIVRNNNTRAQETIRVSEVAVYLKRMKLV